MNGQGYVSGLIAVHLTLPANKLENKTARQIAWRFFFSLFLLREA